MDTIKMSSPKDDHTECGAEASERTNLEDDLADKDVTEAIQTQLGIDTAALTSVSVDPDPTKRTFTVFPNLPFELRTKIWGFTTPAKVIVHALQGFPYRYRIGPYKRPDGVPSILHACQESRFEFLHRDGVTKEHPTYAFLEVSSSEFPASGVFLAPDYDILVAETREVFQHPIVLTLSNIGFHPDSPCFGLESIWDGMDMMRPTLSTMTRLEEIVIFNSFKNDDWCNEVIINDVISDFKKDVPSLDVRIMAWKDWN